MAGKSEAATPRRLKRAREAGDIPLSGVLVQAVALVTGIAVSPLLIESARARFPELLRQAYRAPESTAFLRQTAFDFIWLTLPWLSAVAAAATVATLIQTGGTMRFPASSNSALGKGARDRRPLFDGPRLIATLIGSMCALVIGFVAIALLYRYPRSLANSVFNLPALGPLLDFFLRRLFWWAFGLALLAGLIDWFVVQRFWRDRLKMTRAELREEQREAGNDPERRALQAERRRELSLASPLALLSSATLAVHDGDLVVVLLRYDQYDTVPVVLGVAREHTAADVLERARGLNLPLAEAPELTRRLMQLEPNSYIPEDLYDDVAVLLRPLVDLQSD